ncbi:MAG: polymer-forming cytoskeletal protein [Gemmatimonadota bacterium]|nr:polymer-forming cytoskeletal protein [Gemmatimonadota bacterium]
MAFGSDRSEPRDVARAAGRGEAALTIIAVGTRLVGELDCSGVVKVEGIVVGAVRAERQILVARGGTVEGDLGAPEVVVGGVVQGGVTGADRVEVQTGAAVHGDITTRRLVVQEGGEVNGQINMTEDGTSPIAPPESTGSSESAQV